MKHSILLHEPDDDVGVAVVDIEAGTEVGAVTLKGQAVGSVKLVENVPLGHRVAIRTRPPVWPLTQPSGAPLSDWPMRGQR